VKDPRELYELEPGVATSLKGSGVPMLHLFEGFLDAGRVLHQLTEHLLKVSEHERVATFDVDVLHDYRSRRPAMTFDTYRWTGVTPYELAVDLLRDATGRPYLLMHGPEPDVQWERVIAAILGLTETLGVGRLYTASGIPLAVPHTRPVGLTRTATDEALAAGNPPLIERVEVPGQLSSLLQFRAGEAGRVAMGYVAHVPHYLAQVPYPRGVVRVLDALMDDTGLVISPAGLDESITETDQMLANELESNAETGDLVRALEEAFDATQERIVPVPTADEIGAELERFLAERERGNDA